MAEIDSFNIGGTLYTLPQNAQQLTPGASIDGVLFTGQSNISHYAVCPTSASVASKAAYIEGFSLVAGAKIAIKFSNADTSGAPTLNVSNTGAVAIKRYGTSDPINGAWKDNEVVSLVYDGTYWMIEGVTNAIIDIDDTLTIQGAAADAKATGDAIGDVKSAIETFERGAVLGGKNLFAPSIATVVQGYINTSGGGKIRIGVGNVNNRLIICPITPGTYTASKINSSVFTEADTSEYPVDGTAALHVNPNLSSTTECVFATNSNSKYVIFQVTSSEDSDVDTLVASILAGMQIEEGTTATAYEAPYFIPKCLVGDKPFSSVDLIEKSTDSGQYKLWIPSVYETIDYRNNKPIPLVIGFHGNGSGNASWTNSGYPDRVMVREACIAAGYAFLVVESTATDGLYTWGNKDAVKAYSEAVSDVMDSYNFGKIGVFANSMGGVESLNFISEKKIPIACYVGTSLTFNLAQIFNNGQYTNRITTAYGITENYPYAMACLDKDPALKPMWCFGSFPCHIIGATDDSAILQQYNGFAFYEKMKQFSPCAKIETTGGHAFDLDPYLSGIMTFYNAYLS